MAIEGLGLGDWVRMREDRAVAVMRGRVAIVEVMAERSGFVVRGC